MSFSSQTKEKLTQIHIKGRDARLSQLAGLVKTCGSIRLGRESGLLCRSESLAVGRQIAALAASLYRVDATIGLAACEGRKKALAVVTLSAGDIRAMLLDTGVLSEDAEGVHIEDGVPPALLADPENARAFLRGAFLGSGSCTDPNRSYRLEIIAQTQALSDALLTAIAAFELTARRAIRKEQLVVYLKGDDVSGFLALIGAARFALDYEDVRTERAFRNYINRKSNCEVGNIGKTVDAAVTQIEAIRLIEARIGIRSLSPVLAEAALLRHDHPEASLQQLADMAGIGRSGMNHRLARLMRIAEELKT